MNSRRVLASLPVTIKTEPVPEVPEPLSSTPHHSRAVRQTTLQAFRLLDQLVASDEPSSSKNHVDLRKVVQKLAHAAEYGMTEGLIQRQRAQDLEKTLVRRNQETKSKRQTLTTSLATTGAELLKLRQELDKCQEEFPKTPPKGSRKQKAVRSPKTPHKTRVRFVKLTKPKPKTAGSSSSDTIDGASTGSEVESMSSGNLSEGSCIIVRTASLSIAQTSPTCRSTPPRSQTPRSPTPLPKGKGKQVEGPSKRVLRSQNH